MSLTSKLLILHEQHEGAHAVCEAFRNCRLPVDCTEQYDGYHFRTKHIPGSHFQKLSQAKETVVLLRVTPLEAMQLSPAHSPAEYVCLVLVRTDLLRWAASVYSKINSPRKTAFRDPQFDEPNASSELRISMSAHGLERALSECYRQWHGKVSLMKQLAAQRTRFHLITYEQFLEDGLEYVQHILRHVNRPSLWGAGRNSTDGSVDLGVSSSIDRVCSEGRPRVPLANVSSSNSSPNGGTLPLLGAVHRVHGHLLRDYALNYNDVWLHYLTNQHKYLPWSVVAQNYTDRHV